MALIDTLCSIAFSSSYLYYPQIVKSFSAPPMISLKSILPNHPKEFEGHVYQRSHQGSFPRPCRRRHGRSLCLLQCRTRQCMCSPFHSLSAHTPTYMLECGLRSSNNFVQAQKGTCVKQCRGGSIYINCSASYVCSPIKPQDLKISGLRSES